MSQAEISRDAQKMQRKQKKNCLLEELAEQAWLGLIITFLSQILIFWSEIKQSLENEYEIKHIRMRFHKEFWPIMMGLSSHFLWLLWLDLTKFLLNKTHAHGEDAGALFSKIFIKTRLKRLSIFKAAHQTRSHYPILQSKFDKN